MRKLSVCIWGILFLFLVVEIGYAEQPGTSTFNQAIATCQEYLAAAGFENIQFQIARHQTIWIEYENRCYRNEVTALGIVIGYAAASFPFAKQLVIVPKYRNLPIKFFTVDRERYQQFIRGEISPQQFVENLAVSFQPPSETPLFGYGAPNIRSSMFHFDFIVSPGVKAQFARPDDPAQLQFNFLSDLSGTLAPGLQVYGQWIAPLYNEFQHREATSRIGQLYLNQFIRLPSRTVLSVSAGLFEYDCRGISAQVKKFLGNELLSFSIRTDYLETSSVNKLLDLDSPCHNKFSYLFQVQYDFKQINFTTQLTWGRYLLGDEGWRIDIMRSFHELELGFMGIWNRSLDFLTGMTVRVPFPIARQAQPGIMRIRTPKFIPWNYRYLPCFDGFILNTGENFDEIARQFSISYIRANANQFRAAIRYVKLDSPQQSEKLLARGGK